MKSQFVHQPWALADTTRLLTALLWAAVRLPAPRVVAKLMKSESQDQTLSGPTQQVTSLFDSPVPTLSMNSFISWPLFIVVGSAAVKFVERMVHREGQTIVGMVPPERMINVRAS